MATRFLSLLACLIIVSTAVYAQAPANVFPAEGGCTIGWIGCDPADAIPQGDGSFTCPINKIGLVPITGDRQSVQSNDVNGHVMWHCRGTIVFGQENSIGVDGVGGTIVAVYPETICLFFPAACRGNGAVIANETTVDGAATCRVFGTITTDVQSQITPSGEASLMCFLPS